MRKFRECLEMPMGIAGAAPAKTLTNRLRLLLGKEMKASGHVLSGRHACLMPLNFTTSNYSNICQHLHDKNNSSRSSRACDYRHLLLLTPFVLSNLFC